VLVLTQKAPAHIAAPNAEAVAELDDASDCPPLARVNCLADSTSISIAGHTDATAAVVQPASTAEAVQPVCDGRCGNTAQSQQQQQLRQSLQQPCVQCGKLTKKRCRRCQAVYYCSEDCQIECFEDPQHRAQCEAAAIVSLAQAAACSTQYTKQCAC
jgi:MYND finger